MTKAFISMASLSAVSFAISFINNLLISYYYGTTAKIDTYWLALALIQIVAFYIGPCKEALVPEYHRRLLSGKDDHHVYFSAAMNFILLLLFSSCLLILFFPNFLSGLVVNNNADLQSEVSRFVIVMLPLLFLMASTEILNSVLATYDKVVFCNIGRVISVTVLGASIIALSKFIHVYAIATGYMLGQFCLLIMQCIVLKRSGFHYSLRVPPKIDGSFRKVGGALLGAYLVSQCYILYEKNTLTLLGEGFISAYQYGFTLSQLPHMIFISSLSLVIWPKILEAVNTNDLEYLWGHTRQALRLLTIISGFITLFCFLFSRELIYVLYFRGAFNNESLLLTSTSFRLTILALVPAGFSIIIGRVLISMRKSAAIMLVGLGTAFGGISVLFAGRYWHSMHMVFSHFFASSLMGAALTLLILYINTGEQRKQFFNLPSFSWGIKFILILSLFLIFYPHPVFNQTHKSIIVANLAFHLIVLSLLYIASLLALGILTIDQLKNAYQKLEFRKIGLK